MTDQPKFTPGPWEWGGTPDDIHLQTTHSGKRYVMSFCRKGMRYAQPMFQPSGHGMVRAEDLLLFQVGDRSIVGERVARADGSVYRYDVRGIAAPDAHLIAAAPDLFAALEMAQLWLSVDGRFDMQGIDAALAKARGQS